jgi:hypothetical protein
MLGNLQVQDSLTVWWTKLIAILFLGCSLEPLSQRVSSNYSSGLGGRPPIFIIPMTWIYMVLIDGFDLDKMDTSVDAPRTDLSGVTAEM